MPRSNKSPGRVAGIDFGTVRIGIAVSDDGKTWFQEVYDEIVRVKSDDAAIMTRNVAKQDGLFLGISSGAALTAAREI